MAKVGMVVLMFNTCMIGSAMRRIARRVRRTPNGTPTRTASPPEMSTSLMCCCDW
jgi:hypothetical protein